MARETKIDYKNTLNLPKTDFPMKGNLSRREPEILKWWQEIGLNDLIKKQAEGRKTFILHDGPPYANGDIHVGTAMNKILKDIVVRYWTMAGFASPFIPGWDCHGQPIEHEVEKKLGEEKSNVSQTELRERCREYALYYVDRQREQFRRLGVGGDWDNPYLTLDPEYEATNVIVFGELYKKGLIYKRRKPIHWCWYDKTALAEAEIEYSDEVSPSIYVKFKLLSDFRILNKYKESKYLLIWTTTPWTLPANVAISVHPKANYLAVKADQEILILAEDRLESVIDEVGIKKFTVLTKFAGRQLEHLVCEHVLYPEKRSIIVLADYVALDQGTGAVHTAPGHGEEDYLTGLKYELPSPMMVDSTGHFTEEAQRFAGQHIFKANRSIITDLKQRELLLYESSVVHSYPHCWRCKKPVIFRATEQWFISMDIGNLRQEAIEAIGQVQWIPEWSVRRITSMVDVRPDWCISRQRSWGVPIPVFYCQECGTELVTDESIKAVADLFRKEGADAWFKREAQEILPTGVTCSECGSHHFSKETDILDVWFESGISHEAVLKTRGELIWPADLYLEGSDQHRGWFQSSLLTSVGVHGKAPYKAVLTHGFVVDAMGRKMSKSLGNVVDPLKVIEQSGADILRLWVASSDYTVDVAIGPEILKQVAEAYRRIRNTFRFLLGNLYDFNPATDSLPYEQLLEIDRWILSRLNNLLKIAQRAYNEYRYHVVFHSIHNFCVSDLSAFYLDVLKDRLYASLAFSRERRSAQTAIYEVLLALTKALAPILAFTCEEVWSHIPVDAGKKPSVHLSAWPKPVSEYEDRALEERWERLLKIRGEVAKALEKARNEKKIGNSLEASIKIYANAEDSQFLLTFPEDLATLFIVSDVVVKASNKAPPTIFKSEVIKGLSVEVKKASGDKCERCWRYDVSVGKHGEFEQICTRCASVVKELVKLQARG
jgi:isoleucyl-tRNA synthetase